MSPNYLLRISAQGGLLHELMQALADGANVNESTYGIPVLHVACLSGHIPCVHTLIQAGADLEAEDEHGLTAVQASIQEGRYASAIALLDAGADGSLLWADGRNMLHFAVLSGQDRLIERSVRQGANIHGRSRSGHTPITLAAERNQIGCLKTLLECGANVNHIKGQALSPEANQVISAWRARVASEVNM